MEEQNLADELSPGQQLLWYRIDNVIGRGAFGITYLAEDINLGRRHQGIFSQTVLRAGQ